MNAHVTVNIVPEHSVDLLPEDCAGAGILLFKARRNTSGKHDIEFVLAQEEYCDGWNQSGCWSAFEGGTHRGETHERAAAREFCEETMGTIGVGEHGEIRGEEAIHNALLHSSYVMRVDVRCGTKRGHVTYVMRIPWKMDVSGRFRTVRRRLCKMRALCASEKTLQHRMDAEGLEKPVFLQWLARYSSVHEAFARLPVELQRHEALDYQATCGEQSAALRVRREFLEKRDVGTFSARTLRDMLDNPGRQHHRIRLRFSFVPVLKAVLHELGKADGDAPSPTAPDESDA